MRVILDGNLPVALAGLLVGHVVHTIHERRWSDLNNGALLSAVSAEYDVFVTLDQSLRYQQNLRARPVAVVVVQAHSNRIADIEPLVPQLLAMLSTAPRGEATVIGP